MRRLMLPPLIDIATHVRVDLAHDFGLARSAQQALESVEASGGKPYAIPAGASDHPLGGHGFDPVPAAPMHHRSRGSEEPA